MKITLSFATLLLLSIFSYSQSYTVNGNLGIGELPTHKLSVAGDSKMTGELTVTEKTKLENDVDIEGELKLTNLNAAGIGFQKLLIVDENGNLKKMTDDDFANLIEQFYDRECGPGITSWMPTWNNGIDKIYVDTNCPDLDLKVGIGTENPTSRFHVYGAENSYGLKVEGVTSLHKALAVTKNGIDKFTVSGKGQLSLLKLSQNDIAFNVKDENDDDVFQIMGNGLVYATEIKVRLKENFDFPDYVFEDDYELMSLEELKTYIKTNKKLPNMPSANKVATDGLDLGESDRLLTEKVEELTLYILQLKEELDKLKDENQEIKSTLLNK